MIIMPVFLISANIAALVAAVYRMICGKWREGNFTFSFVLRYWKMVYNNKDWNKGGLFMHKKCSEIDEILNSKMKQKEQMGQYKKSVIYEYVTGKKRVEGAEELYG